MNYEFYLDRSHATSFYIIESEKRGALTFVEHEAGSYTIDFISTKGYENQGLAKALVRKFVRLVGSNHTVMTTPVIDERTNKILWEIVKRCHLPLVINDPRTISQLKIGRVLSGGGIKGIRIEVKEDDSYETDETDYPFSAIFIGYT